ncbi:hypothetical protein BJY01DRAFT_221136 [Aspergillus pseudoustus]|uniref:Secreted protein n=1 Tax=Aspergillus pseudoustus TaxID=1810923 RepID=A0ABR4JB56_9EURO
MLQGGGSIFLISCVFSGHYCGRRKEGTIKRRRHMCSKLSTWKLQEKPGGGVHVTGTSRVPATTTREGRYPLVGSA